MPAHVLLANRYLLLDEIGRGGHATVHRAHDQRLGRDVAVKVLRREASSANVVARFEREIRLTATLEHPHILHVQDTGVHEGRLFLVTELATGGSLADRLVRESPLPMTDALQIVRDVGLALAHAHAHGVVHRDVKPANILLRDGTALLADFGVAFAEPEALQQRLTSAGLAVGTAQYMSPEQLCADPTVDGRSDQYALALVLYELLAGVPAQTARTLEGLRLQRMAAPPLGVRTHRPSVPEPIEQALQTALAPVPADRFRDMAAFLAAIGITASGELRVPGTGGDAAVTAGAGGGAVSGASSVRAAPTVGASTSPRVARPRGMTLLSLGALGVLALLGAAWGVGRARTDPVPDAQAGLERGAASDADDLTRVTVRLTSSASDSLSQRVHAALEAEFGAWPDVTIGTERPAWRVVSAATPLGDSVRVRLTVERGSEDATQHAAIGRLDTDDAVRALAAALAREVLAGASESDAPGLAALPVRSLRAARSYAAGHRAMQAGALEEAERQWRRAASDAPTYAHAAFWAAQVASWRQPREREAWGAMAAAAQAGARAEALEPALVEGLLAMSRGDFPAACVAYRDATTRTPTSFVAWFGLGECQRRDDLVLRRGAELVHRGSAHGTLQAFRRAVETAPTPALLAALYPTIFRATFAEANRTRLGRVDGSDTAITLALPSLRSDTLAFAPVPAASFAAAPVPGSFTAAVRAGRRAAADLTRRWVERFPSSSEGWLAHAEALELGGDLSRAARGIARIEDAVERVRLDDLTPSMRLRTATLGVRLAVRQGALADAAVQARALLADADLRADSSLHAQLAPLAAFVGDTSLLTATMEELRVRDVPRALGSALARYHARAVLGACDGLADDRADVMRLFESGVPAADSARVRNQAIAAADWAAAPCLGPQVLIEQAATTGVIEAMRQLATGDSMSARRTLHQLTAGRTGAVDGAVSWDELYLEAWVSSALGDSMEAVDRLVRAFEGLGEMSGFTFSFTRPAAGLRRATTLFLELTRDRPLDARITNVRQLLARKEEVLP